MARRTVYLVLLLTASVSFAQTQIQSQNPIPESNPSLQPSQSEQYDRYYKIEDPSTLVMSAVLNPVDYMQPKGLLDEAVNLMRWALNRAAWPEPDDPYNRRRDFGTWLRDRHDGSCLNTRAKILVRESQVRVGMNSTGCTVKTGKWYDPYTGQTFTEASKVQIDHMVPLKNAYISGASQWDWPHRCAYANFMANHFHLVVVSGHENMSKGDSTPAEWLPPNRDFLCAYLKDWLSVKLIWGLIMGPHETFAIKRAFRDAHCDPNSFTISPEELAQQREAIDTELSACQ
jgi:hypothetical protein